MAQFRMFKKMKTQLQLALHAVLFTACYGTVHAQENANSPQTSYMESEAQERSAKATSPTTSSTTAVQQIKPVHFVRDVMQPLGMPVVTSFHNIRENLFLNMHAKDATGLEALGDFFLAPSRYLFAGKTIKLIEDNNISFELEQSFHYHTLHRLKTTLSLAVLPVTEFIGAAGKGLTYHSPPVRDKHRMSR
ncbi:MAG: hypothetical protein AB7O89_01830, partial [Parachlamydiales bacterium]